ncbi:Clathrin/coatomer adaptor, adaptin-like protein [Globomyces pollinis-pini]|nr:Clathrin/coatomer adaptor, adaptin-like protein [Globomyces pollinis-pini]
MEKVFSQATFGLSEASRISSKLTSNLIDGFKSPYQTEMTIDQELNSNFDKEKINGLKKLITSISKGEDVSSYFAAVIKNVASTNFEVRKLVYIYLLRYAEQEPDLSLLSINTFQKDLSDPNPMIRTVSLRVLSSIKVPLIVPIITMAFKRATVDLSPFVRKAVAISLPKAFRMDPSQKNELVEIIELILKDKSTLVLGPIIASINEICPDRYDLIHKHFRKLCKVLSVTDEWGQVQIMDMLARYVKSHFVNPSELNELTMDPDHALFIHSLKPLLYSQNPLVVLMVTTIFFDLGMMDLKILSSRSLMRCLTRPKEEQYMILESIKSFITIDPIPWHPYLKSFAVYTQETEVTQNLKLDILDLLLTEDNSLWILSEFQSYARSSNLDLALRSMKVWGRFVTRIPAMAQPTLETLISLLSNGNDNIIGEAIIMIRRILHTENSSQHLMSYDKLIGYLVSIYDTITVPMARASIIWLIGQHLSSFNGAPDALRVSLKTFTTQDVFVKRQILTLAALLVLSSQANPLKDKRIEDFILKAYGYTLKLAKYDLNYDIRDQARLLEATVTPILGNIDHCKRLCFILSQSPPLNETPVDHHTSFTIGTLSHLFNIEMPGYKQFPDWSKEVLASEERNVAVIHRLLKFLGY